MKKIHVELKRLASIVLAMAMLLVSVPMAFPTHAAASATSGKTGDCTWTLDGTVLTIRGNGAMANYPNSKLNRAPWSIDITEVVIGSGVTNLGNYAFSCCTRLTSITIPDSVTSIGKAAFSSCTSLTSITIPDSVTSIGDHAFSGCTSLTGIAIPDSVTSIGTGTFNGCTSLTSITIPDSVTSIGGYAFYDCMSLRSIIIPDSVTSIGDNAFTSTGYYNDPANWNNGVLYISNHLINAKSALSGNYTIKTGTKCIGDSAFYNCTSLTSITIPDSVTSIGNYAFINCTSLRSITIPDSMTSIGTGAFNGCKIRELRIADGSKTVTSAMVVCKGTLWKVIIPESVTNIGASAFYNCTGLTSITIPDSVTSIGNYAFQGCTSLTSITIPDSVTSIGNYAFSGCNNLNRVNISSIKMWCSIVFDGTNANPLCNGADLYLNNKKVENLTIPDGVTSIGGYAFYNCTSLTSITIPDSVTSIGGSAFWECGKLTIRTPENSAAHKYAKSNTIKFYLTKITRHIAPPDLGEVQSVNNQSVRITLQPTDGYEYKCNDGEWQGSNIFEALSFDTEYVFYQRLGKTEINVESAPSAAKIIHTKKKNTLIAAAPRLSSRTAFSISLKETNGYEYSIDGINWQKETLFSELQPNKAYTFYQRIAATDSMYESIKSEGVTFRTDKKDIYIPDPVTLIEKTDTAVIVELIVGYEYKMDDGEWQESNVFAGLTPNSTHRFYQRIAETDTAYASAASEPLEVTTYPERYCADCLNTGLAKDGTSCPTCFGTGRMRMVGDADSDNEITDWDAVLCMRYLAGWNVQVFSGKCFDIDGDRRITDWDGVQFDRYLAGWGQKTNIGATVKGYPPHDHVFGNWIVETPATCMAIGSKYRTCSICDDDEIVSVPKIAHSFADWITDRAATCALEGEKHRTCTDCGYSETVTLQKPAHVYGAWIIDKKNTCTQDGEKHKTCSKCGFEEHTQIPAQHNYGRSVIVYDANCTETGLAFWDCKDCGYRHFYNIDPHGHKPEFYYGHLRCKVCGYEW